MNRYVYLLLGVFLIIAGCYGIYTGRYIGIGTGYGSGREITIEDNIIEFLIMVGFSLYVGVMLIIKTIKEK